MKGTVYATQSLVLYTLFSFTHLRRRFDDDVAAIFDNFQRNITDAVFIIGHLDIEKNSSDLFLQVIRKE